MLSLECLTWFVFSRLDRTTRCSETCVCLTLSAKYSPNGSFLYYLIHFSIGEYYSDEILFLALYYLYVYKEPIQKLRIIYSRCKFKIQHRMHILND